jgi:hypothetical protein
LSDSTDTLKSKLEFYKISSSRYLSQVSEMPHFANPIAFGKKTDSIYKTRDSLVPIMLFMGHYNSIADDAITNGWITRPNVYGVQLHDEGGTNPYHTYGVFAAAVPVQKVVAPKFYFSSSSKGEE